MAKKVSKTADDYVVPLNINGLEGRMLRMPAPKGKKREILLLYGSHANIERTFPLAAELNKYGSVTMPDYPGFGGMDSMYKIGRKPNLDAIADYLASFIKLRYGKRKFTIVGISYGFLVATRMLQKYPEIAERVDLVVSVAGFAHYEDFKLSKVHFTFFKYGSFALKGWFTSKLARLAINKYTVRMMYRTMANRNPKMRDASPEQLKERIAFEEVLWACNDMRTYFAHNYDIFTANLCDARAHTKMYHVSIGADQYFDNYLVEQHLNIIYDKVTVIHVEANAHMPTVIANQDEVAPFIPTQVRRALARK